MKGFGKVIRFKTEPDPFHAHADPGPCKQVQTGHRSGANVIEIQRVREFKQNNDREETCQFYNWIIFSILLDDKFVHIE